MFTFGRARHFQTRSQRFRSLTERLRSFVALLREHESLGTQTPGDRPLDRLSAVIRIDSVSRAIQDVGRTMFAEAVSLGLGDKAEPLASPFEDLVAAQETAEALRAKAIAAEKQAFIDEAHAAALVDAAGGPAAVAIAAYADATAEYFQRVREVRNGSMGGAGGDADFSEPPAEVDAPRARDAAADIEASAPDTQAAVMRSAADAGAPDAASDTSTRPLAASEAVKRLADDPERVGLLRDAVSDGGWFGYKLYAKRSGRTAAEWYRRFVQWGLFEEDKAIHHNRWRAAPKAREVLDMIDESRGAS